MRSSPTTRVNTWFPDNDQDVSFVGVVWPSTPYEPVQSLTLNLATFSDGIRLIGQSNGFASPDLNGCLGMFEISIDAQTPADTRNGPRPSARRRPQPASP